MPEWGLYFRGMDKLALGKRIREIRVVKNLSQDNLAFELGISTSAYSNIEAGKTEITVDRLFKIADVLKTPFAEFFKDMDSPTNQPFVIDQAGNYLDIQTEMKLLKAGMLALQDFCMGQKNEMGSLRSELDNLQLLLKNLRKSRKTRKP